MISCPSSCCSVQPVGAVVVVAGVVTAVDDVVGAPAVEVVGPVVDVPGEDPVVDDDLPAAPCAAPQALNKIAAATTATSVLFPLFMCCCSPRVGSSEV